MLVTFVTCHSDVSRTSRNAPGDSEGDNYKYETPNNTIMIRGLAQHITENDVSRFAVCKCKIHYIVVKKEVGAF
jgi:hypothetical protein